jgi:hypothetical protein
MTTHTHHDGGHAGNTGHATEPETIHRWVVFGDSTVYLSHLSMFSMRIHAIQLIVEAELFNADGAPSTAYSDDRRARPDQRLYTLDPEVFVLSDVLPLDGQAPKRPSLKADLYRNHREQPATGPKRIAQGIDVRIRRVVYAHRYDLAEEPLSNLQYLLFGDATDSYLAHIVSRPPDFDQILRVTVDPEVPADQLAAGLTLTLPDRANALEDRLSEGSDAVAGVLHTDRDLTVQLKPGAQFYFNSDGDMTDPPM